MSELGYLDLVYAVIRMLAIAAGIIFGLAFFSILWLSLSERRHKKA
jgi:hypothetical protein